MLRTNPLGLSMELPLGFEKHNFSKWNNSLVINLAFNDIKMLVAVIYIQASQALPTKTTEEGGELEETNSQSVSV